MTHRYMPFSDSKNQRLAEAIKCDASVSFVEISSNIFPPGATRWDQIKQVHEYQIKIQLFIYYLECLQKINARVVLETLVTNDVTRLGQSRLDPTVRVLGYRVWALIAEEDRVSFCKQLYKTISVGLAPPRVMKRDAAKKARIEKLRSENIETHQKIPDCESELITILHAYGMGIEMEEIEIIPPSASCGKTGLKALTITEYLNANRQFGASSYQKRCVDNDMYEKQKCIGTYIHGDCFFPVLPSGLIRCCRLGTGYFLPNSALDLYQYFLPAYEPSTYEIKSRVAHVLNSNGIHIDIDRMSRKEIIEYADVNNITDVFVYDDARKPGMARLIDSSDMASIRLNGIAMHYDTLRILYDQNHSRLCGLSVWDDTRRFYKDVRNTMQTAFADTMDGIPTVYSKLVVDKNKIGSMIEEKGHWQQKCKNILDYVLDDIKMTGLSKLLVKMHSLVSSNLLLTKNQQWIFILMYARHFITTYHHDNIIMSLIIGGKNGSGKSHVIKTFSQSIAPSLVISQDTVSSLVNTVNDTTRDLHVVLIDDLDKPGCSNLLEKDLTLSTAGITTHYGMKTSRGQKEIEATQTIRRGINITATAHPDSLSAAIVSRSIIIHMVNSVVGGQSEGMSSTMLLDEGTAEDEHAAKIALTLMSARQVAITASHAMGALPAMDVTCACVFLALYERRYGRDSIETRSKMELMRLAHAIKNWNDLSLWYERGVGKHYEFDSAIELMWYASRQFIRMEEMCVAYLIFTHAQSMEKYIRHIAVVLKQYVMVEEGIIIRNENYYVMTLKSPREMVAVLKPIQKQIGVGLFNRCMDKINTYVIKSEPVIRHSKIQTERECMLIHSEWLGRVNTATEDALIKALWNLIETKNTHVNMDYDTESVYVFDAHVRRCLKNPCREAVLPGLEDASSCDIVQAMHFLRDKKTPSGDSMLFEYEHIKSARLSTSQTPSSIPSIRQPSMYKIAHLEYLHIIVSPELFKLQETCDDTNILIKEALVVAGGYTGKKIYTNVGGSMHPSDDDYIIIDSIDTTNIEIDNIYYRGFLNQNMYSEDVDTHTSDLFSADKKTITLNEKSNIESDIKKKMMSKIPLEPSMLDFFQRANDTM